MQYDCDFLTSISAPSRRSPDRSTMGIAPSGDGEFGYQVRIGTRFRSFGFSGTSECGGSLRSRFSARMR